MDAAPTQREARNASKLTVATVAGSLLFAPALLVVHLLSHSQLALAQAADSLSDSLGGIALLFALRTSARAADEDHPHGHSRAEPIGALVVAVLVGVLSIEVLRAALTSAEQPSLDWPVMGAFVAKIAFKTVITLLATHALKTRANPALDALRIDARSDILVCSLSVIGVLLARVGWVKLDAALAIAVALYIAYSAQRLARENVALLMGASAEPERIEALRALVSALPGVERVDLVVATFFGSTLHVHVEIAVQKSLSLIDAHEIGHTVERALLQETDVARAVAHVGPGA